MSDEKNKSDGPKIPLSSAVIHGALAFDPVVHSEKFATMRVGVSNSIKREDGTWNNDIPSSYFDVKINGEAHIKLLKEAMEAGKAKKGAPVRVEGFPIREDYEGREKVSIVSLKKAGAIGYGEKGRANDFTISGNIGSDIRVVEGTNKKGEPYKIYNFSIADTDKEGKTSWYDVSLSGNNPDAKNPKHPMSVMAAGIADGSIGKGAKVSLFGSFQPDSWEKDGVKREKMKMSVKPFDDSLKVIFAAKTKDAAAKEEAAPEAKPEAAASKPKGKGKGKGAAAIKDDEIPF